MLSIGTVVMGVTDMRRAVEFWTTALGYVNGREFADDFNILVPPGGAPLAPGADPVRFGRSDIITFSPGGTSSSGTLYVSDGRDTVVAVVLYGGTGRIRIWSYRRERARWDL